MHLTTRPTRILLWTMQALLAALFLFAGAAKLAMPIEVLEAQAKMSGEFLVFIAIAEVVGALGLILPSALRIQPGLTPLAAAGLTVIMIGAVATSAAMAGASAALFPAAVGFATAFVAYARWRVTATEATPRAWAGQTALWRSRRISA